MRVGLVLSGHSEPTDPTCKRFIEGLRPALERLGEKTWVFSKPPRPGAKLAPLAGLRYRSAGELARLVRERKIDVLHLHGFKRPSDAAALLRVLRETGAASVLTAQSEPDAWSAPLRRLLKAAGRFTSVSEDLRAAFARKCPFLRAKSSVVPNGVDLRRFRPERPGRGRPGAPTILSAGRNLPYKGMDLLVMMLFDLRRRGRDCRLEICGDGYQDGRIQGLARRLGIGGRVRCLGLLDAAGLRRRLDRAAFFCLASRFEGHSLAALEALACGKPVLMSDVGHVPAAVARAAVLVPRGDLPRLTREAERLLASPARRRTLAARGRRAALAFGWEKAARAYRDAYRRAFIQSPRAD